MDRLTSLSGGFFLACQNPQTTSIQPGILARLHQQHYQAAYEFAGIDNIFSAFEYLLNEFLMAFEEPDVRQVMFLGQGGIEIAAIDVQSNSA
jgi:Trk K+ transport system NAD-binding subunit